MSETYPGIVVRPGLKLEDVREKFVGHEPTGRGRETAAPRGYNAELLSNPLLGKFNIYDTWTPGPWVDNFTVSPAGVSCYIEVKTTIGQYPSQAAGRFRIWQAHHYRLLAAAEVYEETRRLHLYLFVVYTVASGVEEEVGKIVVPAIQVDNHIDTWSRTNHITMGDHPHHTVSWRKLLEVLDVSRTEFTNTDTIDLTTGSDCLQRARNHAETVYGKTS